MARLVIKHRDGTLREVDLRAVTSIGRQSTNDIQLPEELASRQHARVIPSGRSFIVEDLRSANGTFVNGQQVQRRVLADGDLIRIGGCELVFRDDAVKDLVGELISDRYRVLGRLGTGGMGTVYRALQISMDRQVALKVLNPELTRDREFVVGFLNEARTAGQLNHPNIIQVHDFGEFKGFYYFSMELVEGENVLATLRRDGKIAPQQAMTILAQLCDALTHAHAHSIVHQDIKPQNLLIDRRHHDVLKLADLGLAKVIGQEKGKRRGLLMGTPHYMAPEQARGAAVDGRTDIYSAGATLFHMLTGRVPYDGKNSIEILTRHVKDDVPDPRQYDVGIPDSAAILAMRMLAKDPAVRPQSAKEVAESAREILSRESARFERAAAAAPAPRAAAGAAGAAQVVPRRQLRRAVRERRQGTPVLPWVIAGLCVVAVTAIWILLGNVWSGPGPGPGPNGPGPVQGLSPEVIGQLFERARMLREQGNYHGAQQVLADLAARSAGTDVERRANAEVAALAGVIRTREEYESLLRFVQRYPKALRNARDQLAGFLKRHPDAPEAADARRQLERVERALADTGSGSSAPAASREQEAETAFRTVADSADALERRQEFFAGERALLDFAGNFTGTPAAGRAKARAEELHARGAAYMGQLLAEAGRQSAGRNYRQATELYSRMIAADPEGQWGRRAHEALATQDAAARAAFDKAWGQAFTSFRAFEFRRCAQQALDGVETVRSTQWQNRLERLAADAAICAELHAAMLKVIETRGGKVASPFRVPVPGGGSEPGKIVGINHLAGGVSVEGGPVTVAVKWADMKPAELAAVYKAFGIPAAHRLAAGILYRHLDLKPEAVAELQAARQVPACRAEAERRIAEIEGRANFLSYDFSGGLQMLDWKATAGTWGLSEGTLSGGGAGESIVELQKTRFPARGLVLSFEFEIKDPKAVFTAELYGSANDYLGVTVDPSQGLALVSAVGGAPLTRIERTLLAAGRRHVLRLVAENNRLTVTADGQAPQSLEVPRLDSISGALRFKVLDGEVRIDNIEVRNAMD